MDGERRDRKDEARSEALSHKPSAYTRDVYGCGAEKGSLSLQIRNGPVKETLEIIERIKNGGTVFTVVDYDGDVKSETIKPYDEFPLRKLSRKPIPEKSLVNANFYISKIEDIWYDGPSNYVPRINERDTLDSDYTPVRIEAWELPAHPLSVFRLDHDNLLVTCADSDALQLFMMARRETVRVMELPTTGPRRLHTREEIIERTLGEASANGADAAFRAKANRGLRLLDARLADARKYLL